VSAAPRSSLRRFDAEVAGLDRRRVPITRTSQEGANPSKKDGERERLGDVVVGAGVERLGLVEVTILRSEHEDRRPVSRLAKLCGDLKSVPAGEQDVEDDQVVAALGSQPQPVFAVEGDLDREALRLETTFNHCGDLLVVLDEEQLHGAILPVEADSRLNGARSSQVGVSTGFVCSRRTKLEGVA